MSTIFPWLKDASYLLYRGVRSLKSPEPDWETLVQQDKALWEAAFTHVKSPKVLIATGTGRHQALAGFEGTLGVALTLRGASVDFLLCDHFLPACLESTLQQTTLENFARFGPKSSLCDSCLRMGKKTLNIPGLQVQYYSQWVSQEQRDHAHQLAQTLPIDQIPTYKLNHYVIGEHALAGTLRYFAKGYLDQEPYTEVVLRRYFEAALLTAYAIERLLLEKQYDVVCFHHGIYVPQGVVGEVTRHLKRRVVNWNPSYRKQTFIFTHEDTYHHKLMDEPVSMWEDIQWNDTLEQQTMGYLKSRWQGTEDWIWFHDQPQFDLEEIKTQIGFDFSKPAIGLLTNVMWDAQLHYPANAFANMLDWVLKTIDYFVQRPELQLIVRIHPAELRGTLLSRQPLLPEIMARYPTLPANIVIIPPESQISTYAVMAQCDSVIIYGTKTGVELTSMGIPVIVAGEAWIRNKGVTIDAQTQTDYFAILDRLPLGQRMANEQRQRARLYAFHFFFRRMIPLYFAHPRKGTPPFEIKLNSLRDLLPGQEPGLDVICDGILNGTEFVYKAEDHG